MNIVPFGEQHIAKFTAWFSALPNNNVWTEESARSRSTQDETYDPALMIAAEEDSLIPIASVEAASKQIPDCELVTLPATGHFEPYTGAVFERVVEREAEFLCAHLLG